jgi:hypothetical protein
LGLAIHAGDADILWDQSISVPAAAADEIVIAKVKISKTVRGRLNALMTRAAPVSIKAERYSSKTTIGRVVVANLPSGVIVSDWPAGVDDLSAMFKQAFRPTPDRVKSITFQTASISQYQPNIGVSWWRIRAKRLSRSESDSDIAVPALPLVSLWTSSGPLPHAKGAQLRRTRDSVRATSTTNDPQLTFEIGPNLGRYRTLVIRAKYEVADGVNVFFGRQIDGRGLAGRVPQAGRWLDLYVQLSNNPFWPTEHGTSIRFDPVSESGVGSSVEIAGIWGSESEISPLEPDLAFYAAKAAHPQTTTQLESRERKSAKR